MMKFMRFLIGTLIYLVGSLFAFLIFLITTEQGLSISFNLANYFLGNVLQAKSLQGRLINHITIKGFSYQENQDHITIDYLDLNWKPLELLKNALHIDKLEIDNANIHLVEAYHPFPVPRFFILHAITIKNSFFKSNELVKPVFIKELILDANNRNQNYLISVNLESGKSHLRLNASYQKTLAFQWDLQIPKLDELIVNAQGSIASHFRGTEKNHQIDFSYSNQQQQFNLSLRGQYTPNHWKGIITSISSKLDTKNYLSQWVGVNFSLDKINNNISLSITPNKSQQLSARILFPNASLEKILSGEQNMKGSLQAADPKLQLISILFPSQKITGTMKLDMAMAGKLSDPQLSGTVELKNGSTFFAPLNITLKNLNVKVTSNPKGLIDLTGSVQSENGTLKITGKGDLHQLDKSIEVNLAGENFSVIKTSEYQANISPQIKLNWKDKTLFVSGQIKIPSALIKPESFEQTMELPREAVFTDEKKPVPEIQLPFRVESTIHLILGDDVKINTEGISGKLHGELTIRDVDGETTGRGEISITDGTYQAYGKPMTIREGRLIFNGGAIDNPGIRLVAFRTITLDPNRFNTPECRGFNMNPQLPKLYEATDIKINIGIQVTGTLDDRQVTLISEPSAFSQSDMLSLMVLGTPMCLVQQGQSQTLLTAISAMSISGSTLTQLQQQIAKAFGLSEITITQVTGTPTLTTPTTKTGTALVLGKALTPKLYISYIYNALTGDHTIRVRYSLSKHWRIQSEQSTSGTAADILYTFER